MMGAPSEKVRELLDELGVEHCDASYKRNAHITSWASGDAVFCFTDESPHQTDLHIENCTPEQAVAATVGERTPDELPVGLTISDDGSLLNWMGENYVRQDAAMVGDETCHMEVHDNLAETEGMGEVWLECDKCHWQMSLEPSTPRFKYCPNCRRRIERESE